MVIVDTILWPIRWVIEAVLSGAHFILQSVGMDPTAGATWFISIAALVLVVRAALIPVFVRQIKSQRKMMEIGPDLKKIQDKYKGKKDQFSREAMSRETMALYSKAGTNPFSSCLPLLLQMPIFFGLFRVLQTAAEGRAGVSFMTKGLAEEFGQAALFNVAPLQAKMSSAFSEESTLSQAGTAGVIATAAVMVVLMSTSQFITQLQIMSKNQSPAMKESPMYRQQRILLYMLPLVFLFSGIFFSLGVMTYWLISNFWTMGQQFIVIRNMPTPGSEAAIEREVRLAKRRARKGIEIIEDAPEEPEEPKGQRQQPPSRNRAKKKTKKKRK